MEKLKQAQNFTTNEHEHEQQILFCLIEIDQLLKDWKKRKCAFQIVIR